MDRIDLKTGFECNNRCTFCVQGEKRSQYGAKSTDELKRILELARNDASEIVFTGGEVTIRDDLAELVSHARALGFSAIQIQTNGRMLASMKMVEDLARCGVTEFSPALHGPNAEVHDGLTRAPGSFRQTVKGIRNVKSIDYPVILNSVVVKANYRLLADTARLFVALRVDQYQFAFVHALGSAGANFDDVVPRLSDAMPFVLQGLQVGIDAQVRCMTEAIPLCFLGGYERFAAEWIIPRTKIFDAEWVIEDFTSQRVTEGKAKGPPCTKCSLNRECEGPWREYPERFGWDEFRPVV